MSYNPAHSNTNKQQTESKERKQEEGVITTKTNKAKNSQLDPPLHPHAETSPTQLAVHTPELK
jgi:hypothetical protein